MTMATEVLWRDFHDRLGRYIRARVPIAEDAEDILQETFLKVHRAKPPSGGNLSAWLYTVVKNQIADHYRSGKRSAAPQALLAEPADYERFEVSEPEQLVSFWLTGMIENLPPKYGQAVRLADIEGRTMAQIAAETGLSVSGAKSRVQRGRDLLLRDLQDCCSFHFDKQGRVASWQRNTPPQCGCD